MIRDVHAVRSRRLLQPLFGVNVDPEAVELPKAVEVARVADELGLDLVGIQDHPYNGGFVDTWTLLTALGATTRRVRLLPNVLDLPLRPPAVLAKAAATLDLLTGGRVELGVGAGAFWQGIASYGGPTRSPGEAVSALEEAIAIFHLIWNSEGQPGPARFEGRFYRLDGAQRGPRPLHPIRIWVGAMRPRMLRLTGRLAHGWSVSNSYVPPQRLPALQQRIDEAAQRHGRSPAGIRRNYNLMGVLDDRTSRFERLRQRGLLVGPADVWVEAIVRYYRDLGMDTFIFWPVAGDEVAQAQRFAQEVVPAARQAIAAVRSAQGTGTGFSTGSAPLRQMAALLNAAGSGTPRGLDAVAKEREEALLRTLESRGAGHRTRLYVSGPVVVLVDDLDAQPGQPAATGNGMGFSKVVADVQGILQSSAGEPLSRIDLVPVYRFVQDSAREHTPQRSEAGPPSEYVVFTPLRPGVSVEQAEQVLEDYRDPLDSLYRRISGLLVVEKWVGGGLFVQYMQARAGMGLDALLQAMAPPALSDGRGRSVWQACVDLLVYPGRVIPMAPVGRP